MNKKSSGKAVFFALAAALVWGLAFAFQRIAASYLQAFTFTMFRSILAGIALGALVVLRSRRGIRPCRKGGEKGLLLGGGVCGVLLFTASVLQQQGMSTTSASMAGFITALYIVLVPVLEVLFLRRKVAPLLWVSVAAAALGLYWICVQPGELSIGRGDALVMLCAVVFAVHILVIEHFVPGTDPIALSCVQFWVCAALSGIGAFLWEQPSLADLAACFPAVAYVGIASGAGGYTLQMAAQKEGDTVVVSLLLSTESVFSLLGGALILRERLTPLQGLGCGMMFAAVILSQLAGSKKTD